MAAALIVAISLTAALPAGGNVALAPPAACSPAVVMNDLLNDGHHKPTDVLRAWLSEANGSLQAVMEVQVGSWLPEHDDPEVVAGYAFLFENEGQTRYVRMSVDADNNAVFDYGTWTLATNTYTQQGLTTGNRDTNLVGAAAAWIDVPAALADAGDLLTGTFVLTYDGIIGGVPTDVDQAPGGVHEQDTARGPDYLVGGSCSSVSISAPASIKGAKTVTIAGSIQPVASGVAVAITRQTLLGATAVTNTTTDASGNYSVQAKVRETTNVSAEANGISSTTRKITVRSLVTIKAVRLANGETRIKGVTNPWLPGRVQLFKTTAFRPTATKQIQGGAFSFTPRRLRPGRYEVIYTPANGRAVRSISPAVRVR